MLNRLLVGTAIAAVLSFGVPAGSFAQQTTNAKQDAKKAGKETKKAGQATGQAVKDAAKATAKATKKAAKRVKHKVTPNMTSARCKDGTVQRGRTKTTACMGHGGVVSR